MIYLLGPEYMLPFVHINLKSLQTKLLGPPRLSPSSSLSPALPDVPYPY